MSNSNGRVDRALYADVGYSWSAAAFKAEQMMPAIALIVSVIASESLAERGVWRFRCLH